MTINYEIFGGDNGNYQICEEGKVKPVAFARRNQSGGGYTVEAADKSASIQMRNLPATGTSNAQAAEIMAKLAGA